jgi:hypothetical protein
MPDDSFKEFVLDQLGTLPELPQIFRQGEQHLQDAF